MNRNYLLGEQGDHVNALLSGCGFNLLKLLKDFILSFFLIFVLKQLRFQVSYRLESIKKVREFKNNQHKKEKVTWISIHNIVEEFIRERTEDTRERTEDTFSTLSYFLYFH